MDKKLLFYNLIRHTFLRIYARGIRFFRKHDLFYRLYIISSRKYISVDNNSTVNISKIYFLMHPTCWTEAICPPHHTGMDSWPLYRARENITNKLQIKLIDEMKQDEAMVVFPIGNSYRMKKLLSYARESLGPRCVVVDENAPPLPQDWKIQQNAIKHFVSHKMDKMDEFLSPLQKNDQSELLDEVRCASSSDNGISFDSLKVIANSYIHARCIKKKIESQKLIIDTKTVRSEVFGESFEGCVMTWTAMLSDYLNFKNPIEKNFDLSVSENLVVLNSEHIESIHLKNDVRVFIWKTSEKKYVLFFARVRSRLCDEKLFIYLDSRKLTIDSYDCSPEPVRPPENNILRIQIFHGIRKDRSDKPCFILVKIDSFEYLIKYLSKLEPAKEMMRVPQN